MPLNMLTTEAVQALMAHGTCKLVDEDRRREARAVLRGAVVPCLGALDVRAERKEVDPDRPGGVGVRDNEVE